MAQAPSTNRAAATSTAATANSLGSWQQTLQSLILPADPQVKAAALQKLRSRTGNANNVARILQDDPALCLVLMQEANKSLSLFGNEVTSLAHSISLLGFPHVETLLRRTQAHDKKSFPYLDEYRQQLSISLHAAHQAVAWAKLNPHWPQQHVFWPALFHRAPIWALWYHAGERMQQLQQSRAQHRGASHRQLEQSLLGINTSELFASLCSNWHLPSPTQQSWQPNLCGSARQWVALSNIAPQPITQPLEAHPKLQQVCNHPAFLIALSNRLADESEWDWYSSRTQRIQRLLAVALNRPLDQIISLSHQHAVETSRRQRLSGCLSPARQLLSFYHKADELNGAVPSKQQAGAGQSNASSNTPPALLTEAKQSLNLLDDTSSGFIEALTRLQQEPESFSSLHEIMNFAVTSLCQQLKFERACVSLLNIHSQTLRTCYSSGVNNNPALKNFRHTLQRGDLFNKLLQKPLSVRLQHDNYSKIWSLLPSNFRQACAVDEFLMMSIFNGKQPMALIYADQGINKLSINDQQYSQFKQFCTAVSQCLEYPR